MCVDVWFGGILEGRLLRTSENLKTKKKFIIIVTVKNIGRSQTKHIACIERHNGCLILTIIYTRLHHSYINNNLLCFNILFKLCSVRYRNIVKY